MKQTKQALLFAAFGVSDPEAAETAIAPILTEAADRWPHRCVALAYTSDRVRTVLKSRHGIEIDSVSDALEKLFSDGFGEIVVQPLLMTDGEEYQRLSSQVFLFQRHWPEAVVQLGVQLLWGDDGVEAVAQVLCREERDGEAFATVYAAHGSDVLCEKNKYPSGAPSVDKQPYHILADMIIGAGRADIIVGTLKGEPDFIEVLDRVRIQRRRWEWSRRK